MERYQLAKGLFPAPSGKPLRGVRVGVPADGDFFLGVPNAEQLAAYRAAVEVVRSLGATITTVRSNALWTAGCPARRRSTTSSGAARWRPTGTRTC